MFNGPRVIMFNGPKGSGKDEAVKHSQLEVLDSTSRHIKMAHPLYFGIEQLFGINTDEWDFIYNNHKEVPHSYLNGMTPREALIWLSEDIFKPKFGSDFFGKVAGRKILEFFTEEPNGCILMSDAGFNDEVKAMMNMVGPERCFMIRIYNGNGFEGDSREYVDPTFVGLPPCNFFEIYNTGSLYEFHTNIKLVVKLIESRKTNG